MLTVNEHIVELWTNMCGFEEERWVQISLPIQILCAVDINDQFQQGAIDKAHFKELKANVLLVTENTIKAAGPDLRTGGRGFLEETLRDVIAKREALKPPEAEAAASTSPVKKKKKKRRKSQVEKPAGGDGPETQSKEPTDPSGTTEDPGAL